MFGLQFSDIYTRIKSYANINNVTNADVKAKRAANDAIRLIASMRNWDILKRESTITPIAGTQSYAILIGTTDFDHIATVNYLSNGIPIPIDILDDDEWGNQVNETIEGTPKICRVTKVSGTLSLELSPRPSASFVAQYTTIYFDYIKKPIELTGDSEIPDVPGTSQQMAIVYLGVADLLAGQGDINGATKYEVKADKLLGLAHKIDDKKKGITPRLGRPLISINQSRGVSIKDY